MKITNIEAIHLRIEDPNIDIFDGSYDNCVIVVETDAGITGISEVESLAPAIKAIIDAPPAHNHARGLRELLIGRDPSDPAALWKLMYDATDLVGRRGLMMHALGGIDIALWDIKGQREGKPICELLGGKRRDRIEAYGTIYPMERTPQTVAAQVKHILDSLNLRNIKFEMESVDLTAELLPAVRRVLGPERGLIVDAALSYTTVEEGLRLLPILKAAGVLFLEAPLPLDDVAGHARMAEFGIPLGVGDLGLTHVSEFIEMMDRGGCSICQPDISMVGGFTGIRTVQEAALSRGKRVVTHAYKSNIEIAANLHFLAAHPGEEMLEFSTSRSPMRWNLTREALPVEADGFVRVPTAPGLGVTLDWDFVNAHRV